MPVTRMESSSGGEIPALLNAMSIRPKALSVASYIAATSSSAVTSAWMNRPPTSSAAALPGLAVEVDDGDLGPLGGQPAGGGQPDAAPGPGDDGDPVQQALHGSVMPRLLSHSSVAMKTFLVSVNASRASGPSSRPSPDCLKPPNGVQ